MKEKILEQGKKLSSWAHPRTNLGQGTPGVLSRFPTVFEGFEFNWMKIVRREIVEIKAVPWVPDFWYPGYKSSKTIACVADPGTQATKSLKQSAY